MQVGLAAVVLCGLVDVGLYTAPASAGNDKSPQPPDKAAPDAPRMLQLEEERPKWDYRVLELDEIMPSPKHISARACFG